MDGSLGCVPRTCGTGAYMCLSALQQRSAPGAVLGVCIWTPCLSAELWASCSSAWDVSGNTIFVLALGIQRYGYRGVAVKFSLCGWLCKGGGLKGFWAQPPKTLNPYTWGGGCLLILRLMFGKATVLRPRKPHRNLLLLLLLLLGSWTISTPLGSQYGSWGTLGSSRAVIRLQS
jgi:hypothetical protein